MDFSFTQKIVLDTAPAFVDFPLEILGVLGLVVFGVVVFDVSEEFLCEVVFLLEAEEELDELELGGALCRFKWSFVLLVGVVLFLCTLCIFISLVVIILINLPLIILRLIRITILLILHPIIKVPHINIFLLFLTNPNKSPSNQLLIIPHSNTLHHYITDYLRDCHVIYGGVLEF